MRILVSACLLGLCTRYDGQSKGEDSVLALAKHHVLIPVCPEQLGGLPTPRPPAEMQKDGGVINQQGQDVTEAFQRGARMALDIARLTGCEAAILKARSPSCGLGQVYDGSFSGTLSPGNGVFAALCLQSDLPVYTEENVHRLMPYTDVKQ